MRFDFFNFDCPPLSVGQKIRAVHLPTGNDCGLLEVTKIVGATYYAKVLEPGDFGSGCETVGTQWLVWPESAWVWQLDQLDRTTLPTIKAEAPKGSTCRRPNCPEPFNPWAEPTRLSDRSHVCFSCRSDGFGVSWGDKDND